jgi:phosphate acetyltransferase
MEVIIENKLFDEIHIGDTATCSRALNAEDIETWAAMTGNLNLVDLDPGPDDTSMFGQGGGLTMWAASLFTTLAGTQLPGLGSIANHIDVDFKRPLPVGLPVTATITVRAKDAARNSILLDCQALNHEGEAVVTGTADILVPRDKRRFASRELPKVRLRREDRYLELLKACEGRPRLVCAVVHPCSDDALTGAIEAAEHDLIEPILVGPEGKIRAIAADANVDISPYRILNSDHSHHSAELSVALVHSGEAQSLMKGSLHTDELLHEVVRKDKGLRTERRISHCFLLAVPTYPRAIIVTDAAINITPDLMTKRDIVQNAIEVAHAIGIHCPKVAILAAVETVTPGMPSTIDAAALCKMADRGQITGGMLDGPLAFDNAIDPDAAATKGIVSPVAGVADILVVPDLEAGNMLAKQLTFMADAEAAGIVIGARVPVILTSRADSARTRLASCAVAVLMEAEIARGRALLKAAE